MNAQAKKELLISGLRETRHKILEAALALPADTRQTTFIGFWSVEDLLAHLVGWDYANLKAINSILADQIPEFYNYYDRDWRTYNAQLVATYKPGGFDEIVKLMQHSHQELIASLKALPAEEFNKDRGLRVKGYKLLIGRLMQAELDDEQEHLRQLEMFKGRELTDTR